MQMNAEENRMFDAATFKKLKEIEQSLKDEIARRNAEIIDLMNKRDEYLAQMLRVVLGKIDAMDTSAESIVRSLAHVVGEKRKQPRSLRGSRTASLAKILRLR
jgi:hypothetical protein